MWANETNQHVLPQVTMGMGSLYLMENCFLCCYQFEINLCCGHKKAWHADRNLRECELITVAPLEGGLERRMWGGQCLHLQSGEVMWRADDVRAKGGLLRLTEVTHQGAVARHDVSQKQAHQNLKCKSVMSCFLP